jgi:hypothetical protein
VRGKGETGRDGIVSFRGRNVGGAVADLIVPSLNNCSKGCSEEIPPDRGRGGGSTEVDVMVACDPLRKGRDWTVL